MSVRNFTTTSLRDAREAILRAERRLEAGATEWPDVDMTPHEIDEARTLLSGIRARLAREILTLEQPAAALVKASA